MMPPDATDRLCRWTLRIIESPTSTLSGRNHVDSRRGWSCIFADWESGEEKRKMGKCSMQDLHFHLTTDPEMRFPGLA